MVILFEYKNKFSQQSGGGKALIIFNNLSHLWKYATANAVTGINRGNFNQSPKKR